MPASRTRLTILCHGYPPAIGGEERWTAELARRLARQHGFRVTVITTYAKNAYHFVDPRQPRLECPPDEDDGDVRIIRCPVINWLAPALRPVQALSYRTHLPGNGLLRTLWQGPISPSMLKHLADHRYDDVWYATPFPLLHLYYPFLIPGRPPLVLKGSVHPNDRWGYERPGLIRLARRAECLVGNTKAEEIWAVDHGVDPGRVAIIPPGVDPDSFKVARGALRHRLGLEEGMLLITYMGQFGEHKGIDTLIEAWAPIHQRIHKSHLVIAGASTPYLARITKLIESCAAAASITVLADISEEVKRSLLADSDIFASPSRAESFGITVIEAWAAGCVVVSGRTTGTAQVVEDGVDGILVEPDQPQDLSAALLSLALQPERRRVLAEAAHRHVLERYRIDQVVDRYASLLRAVAAGRPPGRFAPDDATTTRQSASPTAEDGAYAAPEA